MCFANVVDGFDIMDDIFSLEVNGIYLKETVMIKRATWWDEGGDKLVDVGE